MRSIAKPGWPPHGRPGRLFGLIALVLINVGLVLAPAPQIVLAERPFLSEARARYPQLEGSSFGDCRLCHKNREGGGSRNVFGQDFQIYGYDFAALENRDSDEDGYTNLEEINALTIPSNPRNFPKERTKTEPAPVISGPITRCYVDGRPENATIRPGELPAFGPEMSQVSLFELWQAPGRVDESLSTSEIKGDAARGQKLFEAELIGSRGAVGCLPCHPASLAGAALGPRQIGLGRRSAETIQRPDYTGQAKTVEAYLRQSLIAPEEYVVPGFTAGLMPNNYGNDLTKQEIADLVAFMLTLP